jgi:predicted DNA-binding helix-hairpin-helix protein
MTDADPSVVAEIEAFCERRSADPETVKASGLKNIIEDATADEIAAALTELRARQNGKTG